MAKKISEVDKVVEGQWTGFGVSQQTNISIRIEKMQIYLIVEFSHSVSVYNQCSKEYDRKPINCKALNKYEPKIVKMYKKY